ncbi:hypothetical protein TNCV_4827431 [Trichonephila clavipes]|uniref:Uncharacterized protein n=1 Tax=Trichonephila clavipes TaxID=2585209 RepID=A0A8X6VIZ0_TRICX|nr:hypothetical protein TNCV_4827431 [Trichonephila clavipes]
MGATAKHSLGKREQLKRKRTTALPFSEEHVLVPLNLSQLKRPPVGVVCRLRETVRAQVSSSSLDHGSKLRSPSPKAFV